MSVEQKIQEWHFNNKSIIRLGLVGAPRTGKTTFIWALINNLEYGGCDFALTSYEHEKGSTERSPQKSEDDTPKDETKQEEQKEKNVEKEKEVDEAKSEGPKDEKDLSEKNKEILYEKTEDLFFYEFDGTYKKKQYVIQILDYPGQDLLKADFKDSLINEYLATCDFYFLLTDQATAIKTHYTKEEIDPNKKSDYHKIENILRHYVEDNEARLPIKKAAFNAKDIKKASKFSLKQWCKKILLALFKKRPIDRIKSMYLQKLRFFLVVNKVDQYGCLSPKIDGDILFNDINYHTICRKLALRNARDNEFFEKNISSGFYSLAWQKSLLNLAEQLKATFAFLYQRTSRKVQVFFVSYNNSYYDKQFFSTNDDANHHIYCPYVGNNIEAPIDNIMSIIHEGKKIAVLNRFQKFLTIILLVLICIKLTGAF